VNILTDEIIKSFWIEAWAQEEIGLDEVTDLDLKILRTFLNKVGIYLAQP
jgi:hypothetical protein